MLALAMLSLPQDIEDFLKKNKSQPSFEVDIKMDSKKTTKTSNDKIAKS